MQYVIGIDASTTAPKAVVIDRQGTVIAEGADSYSYDVPRSG